MAVDIDIVPRLHDPRLCISCNLAIFLCLYNYIYMYMYVYIYMHIRWTSHPVIVAIRDHEGYIRVLQYSYYITITGWGFLFIYIYIQSRETGAVTVRICSGGCRKSCPILSAPSTLQCSAVTQVSQARTALGGQQDSGSRLVMGRTGLLCEMVYVGYRRVVRQDYPQECHVQASLLGEVLKRTLREYIEACWD